MKKKILKGIIVALGIAIVAVVWIGNNRMKPEHPYKYKKNHWSFYANDELYQVKNHFSIEVSAKKSKSKYADEEVELIFCEKFRGSGWNEWYLLEESDTTFTIERRIVSEGIGRYRESKLRVRVGIKGNSEGLFKIGCIDTQEGEQILEVHYK